MTKSNIHQKNTYKYFLSLLLKNKLILAIFIFNFISILSFPFILKFGSKNTIVDSMHNLSLFYIGLPSTLLIMFCGLGTFILFIKTKNNNVDLFLEIMPISDKKIFFLKQKAIFFFSIHLILAELPSSIILMFMGIPVSKMALIFLVILLTNLMMTFIWISFFSFIALHLKFVTAILTIVIVIIAFLSGTLIPTISQQSYVINSDFNADEYKKNIVKVDAFDDEGKLIDKTYAIYENPVAIKENKIKTWSPSGFVRFSPFSSMLGIAPALIDKITSSGYETSKLILMNNKLSSGYNKINFKPFDEIKNYKNVILAPINEKTIFDFGDKASRFNGIETQLLDHEIIKSKIKDNNFWKVLKNELILRNEWKSNLSKTDKTIISHIIGLDSNKSTLYSIFKNYDLFYKRYLDGIEKYLTSRYSKEFSDFVIYLWKNHNVKNNVYSYGSLGDIKKVEKFHPSISSYNEHEKANVYDIEYIKRVFFKVLHNSSGNFEMQVLDKQDKYIDMDQTNINNIFNNSTIDSQDALDKYIDKHSTINNLIDLNQKLSTEVSSDIYKIAFRDNVKNNLIIQNKVELQSMQKFPFNWFYESIIIMLAIGAIWLSIQKVTKGDMR